MVHPVVLSAPSRGRPFVGLGAQYFLEASYMFHTRYGAKRTFSFEVGRWCFSVKISNSKFGGWFLKGLDLLSNKVICATNSIGVCCMVIRN